MNYRIICSKYSQLADTHACNHLR